MAVGEVPLHPCFAVEKARVKLKLLIQNKEDWERADVSVQQKSTLQSKDYRRSPF